MAFMVILYDHHGLRAGTTVIPQRRLARPNPRPATSQVIKFVQLEGQATRRSRGTMGSAGEPERINGVRHHGIVRQPLLPRPSTNAGNDSLAWVRGGGESPGFVGRVSALALRNPNASKVNTSEGAEQTGRGGMEEDLASASLRPADECNVLAVSLRTRL